MARRRKVLVCIAAVGFIIVMAVAWRIVPLFTGPALPMGATRLHLNAEPPNMNLACATALLAPSRVTTSGDDLILVAVETGQPVSVVWPAGFAAWRSGGHAVVADPWGGVVGREGDVLDGLGGGLSVDDAFHICPFGIVTKP